MEVKAQFVKAFDEAKQRIRKLEQALLLHDAHQPHAIPLTAFDDLQRVTERMQKLAQEAQEVVQAAPTGRKLTPAQAEEVTAPFIRFQRAMNFALTKINEHENAIVDFDGKLTNLELIRKPSFGPGLKRLQIGFRISSYSHLLQNSF